MALGRFWQIYAPVLPLLKEMLLNPQAEIIEKEATVTAFGQIGIVSEEVISLIGDAYLKCHAKVVTTALAKIRAAYLQIIPPIPFGKDKWAVYFGDVGEEPPLPPNIHEILTGPCPFWPGKKVVETHVLVLIPASVNGKPLTVKSLGELVKAPKQGNPFWI